MYTRLADRVRAIGRPEAGSGARLQEENARRSRRQLPQHIRENPAVAEIFELVERVDPAGQRHARRLAVGIADLGVQRLARLQVFAEAVDRHGLVALEAQRLPARPLLEHERQDAHADEVRAMDALETLRDDGPYSQKLGALGRPVARGAG